MLGSGYMENTSCKPEEASGANAFSGRFCHCALWASEETLLSCICEALITKLYLL